MAFYPIQNQLQFNLDVPSNVQNLAFKFHRPNPIVIDKGGGPPGVVFPAGHAGIHGLPQGGSHDNSGGLNFSSISEDRMSIAMRLAQRDIRKKKEEEHMNRQLGKTRTKSRSPSPKTFGKTKVIRDRASRDRMRRQPVKNKSNLKIKEHDRNRSPKNVKTQTPPRLSRPGGGRVPDLSMPVSSQSPPSRDTDFKLYPVQRTAPSAQPEKEIERLQHEMEGYLQQIQVIEQRAMNDQNTSFLQPSSKHRPKDGYLEVDEGAQRKQARMEELTTRTSRQLYMLRQQVREMQNEFIRLGPEKIKHTKKSRSSTRLAAAHRGAVRAIQSFVANLPHTDLSGGLPATYHELALLIRQMTLLSNQVASEKSSVQGDLLKMLDKVDDLNKAWCQDLPEKEISKSVVTKTKEPPRVPPTYQDPPQRGRPVQRRTIGKENKPVKGIIKPSAAGSRKIEKPRQAAKDVTPDRKAAMRAGIAALVEAGELKRGRAGMAWEVSGHQPSQAPAKSLILPAKLQEKRARAQRAVVQGNTDCHFADPTVSSNLKSVTPQHNLIMERSFSAPPTPSGRMRSTSPGQRREPWRPGGTARTPSKGRRRTRSQSPALQRCHLIQDMLDGDLVKTLFPDDMEQIQKQKTPVRGRQTYSATSRRERAARSQSPSERLIDNAEKAIQRRLQPLLAQAEEIACRQEMMMAATDPNFKRGITDDITNVSFPSPMIILCKLNVAARSQSPSERLIDNAEKAIQRRLQPLLAQAEEIACRQEMMMAATDPNFKRGITDDITNPEERRDVLTEMILQDVITDTAEEFQALERQELAEKKAAALQDRPTLENLMYKLEQMEEERHNIRRRWATVQFSETEPLTKPSMRDSGRPLAPAAMEITRHTVPPRTIQKNMHREFTKNRDDEPIIFTKMKSEVKFTELKTSFQTDFDDGPLKDSAYDIRGRPEVQISIPKSVREKITAGVEAYDRYLKKTSHQRIGKFDPWRLMEEVADHILEECMADIAGELEDLNEAIVTNVCKSEFLVPKETEDSSPASPFLTQHSPAPRDSPTMVVFKDQPVHFSIPDVDDETSVKHIDEDSMTKASDRDDDYEDDDDDFEDYEDDYEDEVSI
ncbi:protein moonraker-like [Mizuhopecten yessoensis]|uniref:protein moonraker-like n=2 Tax=Mizuhopecten yessoensis TaxID=6573 RepID=UPI000B45CAAD|nr:protein moonraker-like [Mizuhopecten yessoensis]